MTRSKFIILIINFGIISSCSYALANEIIENKSWEERSPIIYFGDRSNENWNYVDDLSNDEKSFSEHLKRIDISDNGDWKVSISGTNRVRFEDRRNKNFINGNDQKSEIAAGLQISSDISYKNWLRFFGEVRTSYKNFDRFSPIDDAGTDIQQLYADISNIELESGVLSARLGRQEISLNFWQMMSRETLPVQANWDALSVNYEINDYKLTGYYGEENFPKIEFLNGSPSSSGNWDDEKNGNTSSGLFLEKFTNYGLLKPFITTNHLESSHFVNIPTGEENIQSMGASLYKMQPFGISYLADVIYQTGKSSGMDVSAYMAHLNLSFAFEQDWHYRVGGIAHIASGSDANSSKVTTFNSLWTGDPLGSAVDAGYGNAIQANFTGTIHLA
jgi:hypothetical protein